MMWTKNKGTLIPRASKVHSQNWYFEMGISKHFHKCCSEKEEVCVLCKEMGGGVYLRYNNYREILGRAELWGGGVRGGFVEWMTGLGTLQLATVVLLEFPEEALGKHQRDNWGVKNLACLAHEIHTRSNPTTIFEDKKSILLLELPMTKAFQYPCFVYPMMSLTRRGAQRPIQPRDQNNSRFGLLQEPNPLLW